MQWILLVAIEIGAVYCAWTAVTSSRTSQGSIGWVIFLVAAPYIALPIYLILGHHRFKGYVISRRASERVVSAIRTHGVEHRPLHNPSINPTPFEKISDLPVTRGNNVRLLIDGKATFETMFAAIEDSTHYVLVQFYIIHDDELGRSLKQSLVAASRRGVRVSLMVDPVGSYRLPSTYLDELRSEGVNVVNPRRARGPKNRFQLNFRNHRKTVVVDGVIGFTGGLNVGDEYMGRNPIFGRWRDTHAQIEGPIVAQLQLIFVEDWHWATDELRLDDLNWEPGHAVADKTAMIVPTGPADVMETGQFFFFSAITAAQERVWISSPYFVPDTDILTALKHAALRGVDVRLLVPDNIDHYIPWLAAFAYFDELRDTGVKIYRFTDGFLHQKAILVDREFMAVGTSNLDNRSFRLNFETMAVFLMMGLRRRSKRCLKTISDKPFFWKNRLGSNPTFCVSGHQLRAYSLLCCDGEASEICVSYAELLVAMSNCDRSVAG